MKEHRKHRKSCIVGHDATSFSPLLFCALFIFFAFGPLGPLAAILGYIFLGRLIVATPKIVLPLMSFFRRMPMWGVGLIMATLLAVAGFAYSPWSPLEPPAARPLQPTQSKINRENPIVIEETHSGESDSCNQCDGLLIRNDPDITQWNQSKKSHHVTLTIFQSKPVPKADTKARNPVNKPDTILHDELTYPPSPPGIGDF